LTYTLGRCVIRFTALRVTSAAHEGTQPRVNRAGASRPPREARYGVTHPRRGVDALSVGADRHREDRVEALPVAQPSIPPWLMHAFQSASWASCPLVVLRAKDAIASLVPEAT
jgi:hypothetical protein